jgi:hypothetical protein
MLKAIVPWGPISRSTRTQPDGWSTSAGSCASVSGSATARAGWASCRIGSTCPGKGLVHGTPRQTAPRRRHSGNGWPAPSAWVPWDGVLVRINVSRFRASALARMDRARRGPHRRPAPWP